MGTSFGRYKIAEELGRGAMGVVYRAVDPTIGRSVAIKAINRSYLESLGVRPEEYGERFQREAQVAGALNHPHIVKVFDLGPDYLVMEYVEGQTLAALLRARGRLPHATALRMLGQAAAALDHAHASGVVHRDIKPANVMVQPDGSVKVMDFGLARIESSTLTAAGEVLGSAAYMAPEVVLGHPADARSDNFSLAVVAYELLTGLRPFAGPTVSAIIQSVVRTTPRSVRELDATLPAEVDAVFTRALAKEPAERYPLAGDFARALAVAPWSPSADSGASLDPAAAPEPGQATVILATASMMLPADEVLTAEEATTILTVDADELSEPGEPLAEVAALVDAPADEVDAGGEAEASPASAALSAPPPAAPEVEATSATAKLRVLPAPPAHVDEEALAATVILKAPPAPPVAVPAPAAHESSADESAATVILRAPAPPAPPAHVDEETPASTDILKAQPAVPAAPAHEPDSEEPAATVILRAPSPATPPAAAAHETSADEPLATVILKAPVPPSVAQAGPEDPTLVRPAPSTSRGPERPVSPAPEFAATVTLAADGLALGAAAAVAAASWTGEPASTVALPASPLPPPPVATAAPPPRTPPLPMAPPAAVVPPTPPTPPLPMAPPAAALGAQPAVPAVPAAKPPAARRKTPIGWILAVVTVILLLFGAAVAGFFWLVRSQNAKSSAASPAPVAESTSPATEASPPSEASAPPAAEAETAPTPEAPAPEVTTAPAAAAPQPATLVINSDPAGATVTIGRRKRGRTPLRLSVPAGTAAVVLEKEGFKPWRESPRLKPGETRTLEARLEPLAPPRAAPTPPPPPPAKPAVREGDLVTLGPDVTPPRKLSGDSPKIPDKLRRKLSGSAVVEFVVGIDGRVSDAKMVDSINLVVDKAVLDAVATWRYEPARSHGVRVRVVQHAKFTFVSG